MISRVSTAALQPSFLNISDTWVTVSGLASGGGSHCSYLIHWSEFCQNESKYFMVRLFAY